jgi:signal transduction histidine kinase
MNFGIKFRLVALAAGIAVGGLLIGLMTVKSQQQADLLRERLNRVESESFRIADDFREFLRRLNNSLYEYGSRPGPADRDQVLKASHDLDVWIDEQKPKLTTAQEKALMQQIDVAYDGYQRVANELLEKVQTARSPEAPDIYSDLRMESQRLFELGQLLAKAHFDSRGALLAEANRTITELRVLVLMALGGLFLFGLALAWVVYRDMIAPLQTRLVESQTLLERQEKLASLGMLAAGIAHEIRNPLTAIKAALFIQQKRFQPGTQDHADAKVVEREILRLEKIVNDFLLFARPIDPEMSPITVGELLQEVVALLEPALAKNNVQLVLEPPPPLRINVDAPQMKQVLINLVQNAADACGGKGTVKLRARQDRKRLEGADKNVAILEIEDNGRGIPPELAKRLFDPFFTTKESGTGLGLSIAAGIVQKHQGALQYQTRPGHGTTFGVVLPLSMGEIRQREN